MKKIVLFLFFGFISNTLLSFKIPIGQLQIIKEIEATEQTPQGEKKRLDLIAWLFINLDPIHSPSVLVRIIGATYLPSKVQASQIQGNYLVFIHPDGIDKTLPRGLYYWRTQGAMGLNLRESAYSPQTTAKSVTYHDIDWKWMASQGQFQETYQGIGGQLRTDAWHSENKRPFPSDYTRAILVEETYPPAIPHIEIVAHDVPPTVGYQIKDNPEQHEPMQEPILLLDIKDQVEEIATYKSPYLLMQAVMFDKNLLYKYYDAGIMLSKYKEIYEDPLTKGRILAVNYYYIYRFDDKQFMYLTDGMNETRLTFPNPLPFDFFAKSILDITKLKGKKDLGEQVNIPEFDLISLVDPIVKRLKNLTDQNIKKTQQQRVANFMANYLIHDPADFAFLEVDHINLLAAANTNLLTKLFNEVIIKVPVTADIDTGLGYLVTERMNKGLLTQEEKKELTKMAQENSRKVLVNKLQALQIPGIPSPTVSTAPTVPTRPTVPTAPTVPTLPTRSTVPTVPTRPTMPTIPTRPTAAVNLRPLFNLLDELDAQLILLQTMLLNLP